MNGLKTTQMTREQILEAMKTPPPSGYFVWDGIDEDDRPATEVEMRAGIKQHNAALKSKGGRPRSDTPKIYTGIRLDADIVAAFKATGKGWQTRVNEALKEWLREHAA